MDIEQKQNKNIFPSSIYTFKAEELNQIVNELQHIITAGGLTPDNTDTTQVLQSLRLIFSGVEALTGIYIPYGGDILPQGWLWCDGSALSRVDYSGLFARIGTTFGAGDGSTTFNIPNLTGGRFIEGRSSSGTYKNAGLPNITGNLLYVAGSNANPADGDGAFSRTEYSNNKWGVGDYNLYRSNISFDASRSSSIYGASTTVQPRSLTSRWIIKY